MELWFLGTSAGMPVPERNVTSIVLRMSQSGGKFWMFDCGEGTQHQLMRMPFRLTRLEKLFITHLHGDHIFGLPGLLSSRSSLGATEPLDLYGPEGIREFIESALRISGSHLSYTLQIHEIDEGTIYEDETYKVETAKLEHRVDSFGFRVTEHPRSGTLNAELLAEMGIPAGPEYGRLKAGQDVLLEDGRTIHSVDVTGSPLPGRVIVVLGDTKPCRSAVELARDADLLVHEATFGHELVEKAEEYGHSTALQAAQIAQAAGIKWLILTHFSTRYKLGDLVLLEEEARTVFEHTDAALELQPYEIPHAALTSDANE
ncbi:ribonuclease Z [Cohnella sp. WQ 127256]|uniref:ribonuclease Z n=1 Tax=Cohnella sp. WQ 127256 TaxID=2938790 RepID=UPI00211971B3|nr:ribonuclease Z [Cohnella sp. WQ 127256]